MLCFGVAAKGACRAVGVGNKNKIPDNQITASSYYLRYYPSKGRLNGPDGWCQKPYGITNGDYIQVDMGKVRSVCAVATQGKRSGSYIKSYKLSLSTDGNTWNTYKEQNVEKV